MCIYIYICITVTKSTPPEKKTLESTSLKSARSGAGEQSLPLTCWAKARLKGVFFSQTPVSWPRYDIFSGAVHRKRLHGALTIFHTGGSVVRVGVAILVLAYTAVRQLAHQLTELCLRSSDRNY